MLKPIEVESTTYECTHKEMWPPPYAKMADAQVRAISDTIYEQVKTWRRVCGLDEMNSEKCLKCPLVLQHTPKGLVAINKTSPVQAHGIAALGRAGLQRP